MAQTWKVPDRGAIGVIFLIITETSLFSMFVAAYLVYIGASLTGPYPKDVLEIPWFSTLCLWSSSLTVYFAEHALLHNNLARFKLWWIATILLGGEFLTATGVEWHKLIYKDHLTMSTNLFGTTFYSLVGLHASHVVVGLTFLLLVLIVTLRGFPIQTQFRRVKFLSWYWHFVDGVWVVVFTVVYFIGR
ncbi:MAG: heme-copper oxidase subunit III [Acidobacteriaceae bacterium]|nr:heme-copper oxidase subunit III [Acidobacteriaceae bacterium]